MILVGKTPNAPDRIDLNKIGVKQARLDSSSKVGRYSHVRDTELNLVERTRRQGAKAPTFTIRGGSYVFTKLQYPNLEDVMPELQKLSKMRNHIFDLEIVGTSWGSWIAERVNSDIGEWSWSADLGTYVPVTWDYSIMLVESVEDGSSSVTLS